MDSQKGGIVYLWKRFTKSDYFSSLTFAVHIQVWYRSTLNDTCQKETRCGLTMVLGATTLFLQHMDLEHVLALVYSNQRLLMH